MPRVSIVLPVWNGEKFLPESVNSVINQTFTDWELIIVNDCSTDNTLEVAKQLAKMDKRIHVYSNDVNKKLPATLNVGFSHAVGEYLTWTSDDNIAKPNWLAVLVDYLDKNPDVDMVSATMDYIDEDGKFLFSTKLSTTPATLAYRCNVGAAFMYRRQIAEIVGEYDEYTFCAEDYDYWCRIALNGNVAYIPDNIYLYRTNSQSLTAQQQPRIKQKTAYIQDKYRKQFFEKFKLGYLTRAKIEYLCINHKYRPIFVLFDMYKFLYKNIANALFFWNKRYRRKICEFCQMGI
ncbi:MAG: glycosyltransferase family 2 protein [Alphaproteobacteria bacterium]|nr:glycosyltransferase family 2 protein [Alphaproteobacteria bacterium]